MKKYPYLIIGGGMTADSAAKTIRKLDRNAEITIISAEELPPYKRPPLTKDLWKGKEFDSIWLKTEQKDVEIILNTRIVSLDVTTKQVRDEKGNIYPFDKLLLATGGRVRKLPFGDDHIHYFRYAKDYLYLANQAQVMDKFTVLRGGFIGSELTAALAMKGKSVTIVFPEVGIGANIFPEDLSLFLNDFYREKGVKVMNGEAATSLEGEEGHWKIITDQHEIISEMILAGIGIMPNTELAIQAGLETDNGIVVDAFLQTSHPDIYAAGDVAIIQNSILEKKIRYEHEDNAVKMGETAGKNMTGKLTRYDEYLPYFYSDLFELGYEAVGLLDPKSSIIADWQEKYKKGVIYYHNEGKVRGILLWNVWGALNDARQVIKDTHASPIDPSDLKGRIK